MKQKKRAMSREALEMVADQFKALSDPLRLKILQSLEGGEVSVGELAKASGTSQPNVSKHLKILSHVGFLNKRQHGNIVYYAISDPMVFELCELVCGSIDRHLTKKAKAF